MNRDESRDVFILTEDGEPLMNEMCISTRKGTLLDEVIDESQEETRYVPFSQLETEREVLRDVKREAAEIIARLDARIARLRGGIEEICSGRRLSPECTFQDLQHDCRIYLTRDKLP